MRKAMSTGNGLGKQESRANGAAVFTLCLVGIVSMQAVPNGPGSLRTRGRGGFHSRQRSRKPQPLLNLGTKIMMLRSDRFTNPKFCNPQNLRFLAS